MPGWPDWIEMVGIVLILIVGLRTLHQTKTFERAKLAADLWQRQAVFAEQFAKLMLDLHGTLQPFGIMDKKATELALLKACHTLEQHAPVVPTALYKEAEALLTSTSRMLLTGKAETEGGPLTKATAGARAFEQRRALIDETGFPSVIDKIRSMLDTDALTRARAHAIGLEPSGLQKAWSCVSSQVRKLIRRA